MKKKYIFLGSIVIFLGCLVMGCFVFKYCLTGTKIELDSWCNPYARNLVCKAKVIGDVHTSYHDCEAGFVSKTPIDKIASTNKEAYVGDIVYYDECLEYPGKLFFGDNNYYVLYEDDGMYRVRSCYMDYEMGGSSVYVPCPVYLVVSDGALELYKEKGQNMLDILFDAYDYKAAKEFYERFDTEYVTMDDEKQMIILDGYDIRKEESMEQCLTLDFSKRQIIGQNEEGENITISGK